jgi:hypothetical protein
VYAGAPVCYNEDTTSERGETLSEILIGHVGVDSGQVMVGDPCYLDDFEAQGDGPERMDHPEPYPFSYEGACSATLSARAAGELGSGLAVVASTGWGDGLYPVYAEVDPTSGRIAALRVVFIEDAEDAEDEAAGSTCEICGVEVEVWEDLCGPCEEAEAGDEDVDGP